MSALAMCTESNEIMNLRSQEYLLPCMFNLIEVLGWVIAIIIYLVRIPEYYRSYSVSGGL